MQHRIFDYESSEQLLHDRQIAGLQLPFARETGILKTPLRLGQRQIENRLAAQPVEGFDALPDGSPSEKNMARYRAYGGKSDDAKVTLFTSLILFFTGLLKPGSQNARTPPLDEKRRFWTRGKSRSYGHK